MAEDLSISIGAKDNGALTTIKQLNSQLKFLDKQYNITKNGIKGFGDSIQGQKAKLEMLKQSYELNTQKLQKYKQKLQESQNSLNSNKTALEKLKNEHEKNAEAVEKARNELNKEKESLEKLKKAEGNHSEAIAKTKQSIAEKEKALEKLEKAESNSASAIKKTEKNINSANEKIRTSSNNIKLTEATLESLNSQIEETNNKIKNNPIEQYAKKFESAGKSFQNAGDKLKAFGDGTDKVGNTLIKASTPFVAFTAYATKVGISFEEAIAKLGATSGASAKEMETLRTSSINLGEDIKGASATDVAKSYQLLAQSGYSVNEMMKAIEPNVKASIGFGSDMTQTSDEVVSSLHALGKEADYTGRYLDIVAQAGRKSNTTGNELMQAYKECGGIFRELNVPVEESATLLSILANRGVKSSEAGHAMNSTLINLLGTAGESSKALETLGLSAYDTDGKFIGVTQTLRNLKSRLSECTEEQKNQFTALIGGKEQYSTLAGLLDGLDKEYGSLHNSLVNSNGALEEMYQTMSNTTAGKIDEFKGKLETLGLKLEDELLPHINDLLDKGMEFLEWFDSLDEGTKKTIIQIGLFTGVLGVGAKAVGKFASGIGSIVKAGGKLISWAGKSTSLMSKLSSIFGSSATAAEGIGKATTTAAGGLGKVATTVAGTSSKGAILSKVLGTIGGNLTKIVPGAAAVAGGLYLVHENSQYLNRSMITTTDELSGLEKAFNKLDGSVLKSRKQQEELGWVYKDWSSKVSKDYAKSLDETAEKMRNLNFEVQRLSNSNIVITPETKDNLVSQTSEMCNSIIEEIRSKGSETTKALQEAFNGNGKKDWYEDTVISSMNKVNSEYVTQIQEKEQQINAIYEKAASEHREIAVSEKATIEEIYGQIADIKAKALAMDNDDYSEAIASFQVKARKVNAEGISGMLEDEKKNQKERIDSLNEYYDTRVQEILNGTDMSNASERIAAQAAINDLRAEQETKINSERDYYKSLIKVAEEEYPELAKIIDFETGKIRDVTEQRNYEIFQSELEKIEGINEVTKTGMETLATTLEDGTIAYQDYYVKVDESTGKVIGTWNRATGEITSENAKVAAELEKTKAEYNQLDNEARQDILSIIQSNNNMSGSTKSMAAEVVGRLRDIQTQSDGTKRGIIELNGSRIEVKVNKDGTIANLRDIKSMMDNIPRVIHTTVMTTYKDGNGGTFQGSRYTSDGRGGYYLPGYATGTTKAKRGLAFIAENGAELIRDGDKVFLATQMQVHNFKGGEEVFNADETRKLLSQDYITSGGYFSPNSDESRELIQYTTNNNYNTTNNNSSSNLELQELYKKMDMMIQAIQGMSIYMNCEKVGGIVDRYQGKMLSLEERRGF